MTTRRALLVVMTGALLTAGVGACARSPASGRSVRTAAEPPIRVRRAWPVMGTLLTITAWGADTAVILVAIHAARDSVRLVDSLMSVYRPESDISTVNRNAGGSPIRVAAQTMHVLRRAHDFWRISGGAFDPTVGPLVDAWGFRGDTGRVPTAAALDSLRGLIGFQAVQIDSAASTVRLSRAGMLLDLGGIAKGYALDLGRSAMRNAAITGGMLDLGGNVLVFGHPPTGGTWKIGIRHPRSGSALLGMLALDSGAVATSGDYEHFYEIDGVRYAHLLDPRTGAPSRGIVAATAIGPAGQWSDGLSATLFLSGASRGVSIADSLRGTGAVYVLDDGTGRVSRAGIVLSARARAWFTVDSAVR